MGGRLHARHLVTLLAVSGSAPAARGRAPIESARPVLDPYRSECEAGIIAADMEIASPPLAAAPQSPLAIRAWRTGVLAHMVSAAGAWAIAVAAGYVVYERTGCRGGRGADDRRPPAGDRLRRALGGDRRRVRRARGRPLAHHAAGRPRCRRGRGRLGRRAAHRRGLRRDLAGLGARRTGDAARGQLHDARGDPPARHRAQQRRGLRGGPPRVRGRRRRGRRRRAARRARARPSPGRGRGRVRAVRRPGAPTRAAPARPPHAAPRPPSRMVARCRGAVPRVHAAAARAPRADDRSAPR
jgi:hypothetical protein